MAGFFANVTVNTGQSLLKNSSGGPLTTPGGTISQDGYAALLAGFIPGGIPAQAPENLPTTGLVVRADPVNQISAYLKQHTLIAAVVATAAIYLIWRAVK